MADDIGAWKQEVLRDQGQPKIRKRNIPGLEGLNNDEILEMGNALEETTKGRGWLIIESWIYKDANPNAILALKNDFDRGFVAGEMRVMQRVKSMISARDDILAKEQEKEEKKKEENKIKT